LPHWPLTCYAPESKGLNQGSEHLVDLSPEEHRWEAYKALKNQGLQQHLDKEAELFNKTSRFIKEEVVPNCIKVLTDKFNARKGTTHSQDWPRGRRRSIGGYGSDRNYGDGYHGGGRGRGGYNNRGGGRGGFAMQDS